MTRTIVGLVFPQVQAFIEAARTTRDLWMGSALQSDLAGAAAQALLEAAPQARIVFPAPVAAGATQPTGLPNKLVAIVDHHAPAELEGPVRRQLQAWWQGEGRKLQTRLGDLAAGLDLTRLEAQLRDPTMPLLAWSTWADGEPYAIALDRMQSLLDARKRTAVFAQTPEGANGDLLSSLDGRRESVIRPGPAGQALRDRFHLPQHEALDAVGLLKRLGRMESGFPSVARVALEPWVRQLDLDAEQALARELRRLIRQGHDGSLYRVAPAFPIVNEDGHLSEVANPLRRLHFDCEMLLPSRRPRLRLNHAATHGRENPFHALEALLRAARAPGEDALYVAMLVADGDHMGRWLAHEGLEAATHQAISAALAGFSQQCQAWAAGLGAVCVYAGGDDVLALSPVDTVLALAQKLSTEFGASLRRAWPAGLAVPTPPSLSVGIAFAHVLQPMGEVRAAARRALALAKAGTDGQGLRNALGVVVMPRSGGEVQVVGRHDEAWSAARPAGLASRLDTWVQLFAQGLLSASAGHDLQRLVRAVPATALRDEAARLVARRSLAAMPPEFAEGLDWLLRPGGATARDAHGRLAAEWYVGRWLALHQVGIATTSTSTAPVPA